MEREIESDGLHHCYGLISLDTVCKILVLLEQIYREFFILFWIFWSVVECVNFLEQLLVLPNFLHFVQVDFVLFLVLRILYSLEKNHHWVELSTFIG